MAEAGVALAAVRVQDSEGRSPAGWPGAIARDHHLRSLADHVPAEPDPRSAGQLEPDPRRFADRACEAARAGHIRWLEHDGVARLGKSQHCVAVFGLGQGGGDTVTVGAVT